MPPPVRNLVADLPADSTEEWLAPLHTSAALRIERIASYGQASPAGFWYDQEHAEWVLLVRGSAELAFADDACVSLAAGDWLLIPAHCRHRVERTSRDALWLAVHFDDAADT